MDITEVMTAPTIITICITLALATIGFIVWLVRLEGKANSGSVRQKEFEAEVRIEVAEGESKLALLEKDFWKHVADVKAHHNEQASVEFRTGLERRLAEMEFDLKDIGRKLNHIAARE